MPSGPSPRRLPTRKAWRPASSSSTDRVRVGRIGAAHGLAGEVTLIPESDDPDRFAVGAVFSTEGPDERTLTLVAVRRHSGRLVVRFDGYDDRTAAESLRNAVLTIPASARRRLEPDEYWPDDLVGVEARTPDGLVLGKVIRVILGGAQDRLVVDTGSGEVEVPFVDPLVPEVDLAAGRVVIDPPAGLF